MTKDEEEKKASEDFLRLDSCNFSSAMRILKELKGGSEFPRCNQESGRPMSHSARPSLEIQTLQANWAISGALGTNLATPGE
jgi:hypothetical protein